MQIQKISPKVSSLNTASFVNQNNLLHKHFAFIPFTGNVEDSFTDSNKYKLKTDKRSPYNIDKIIAKDFYANGIDELVQNGQKNGNTDNFSWQTGIFGNVKYTTGIEYEKPDANALTTNLSKFGDQIIDIFDIKPILDMEAFSPLIVAEMDDYLKDRGYVLGSPEPHQGLYNKYLAVNSIQGPFKIKIIHDEDEPYGVYNVIFADNKNQLQAELQFSTTNSPRMDVYTSRKSIDSGKPDFIVMFDYGTFKQKAITLHEKTITMKKQ